MTDKQIIIDEIKLHGNRKDLTGLKVGKLTCLKPVKTEKNKNSEWLCECECGNFKIAQTYRLLSGRIQSCGDCYHTINHYIPMIKELEKQLKAKEQECERLKKQLIQKSEVDMFFNTPIEGWSNDPCGICRYKQTLTEIKEIAKFQLKDDCKDFRILNCNIDVIKQILQKISDCEANND